LPKNANFTSIFNPGELASLWHLPNERFVATKIQWSKKHAPLPEIMRGKREGVQLGYNLAYGQPEAVYLKRENRTSHSYVVGRTGFGKSNYLHHQIHQDIEAGYGVCVIDPHGALVSDILRYSIPKAREEEVIVLDLSADKYPIPLNMLAAPEEIPWEARAAQLDGLFKRYGNFGDTVTLAPALWHSLLLLQAEKRPILPDLIWLLNNAQYRSKLYAQAERNPALESFWETFEAKNEALRETVTVFPLTERVRKFFETTALYAMTCHPDILDFRRYVSEGKIILFSLNDPKGQWTADQKQLLGGIMVSQVTMGAWARGTDGNPFYLYIDEAENFLHTPIPQVLEQARKYGLSLTLANQYLSQLQGDVLKSVMGTVGAFTAFQLGYDDAQSLAHYLSGFRVDDLVNLDKYEAAVRLQYDERTYALSLQTLPPFDLGKKGQDTPREALEREEALRAQSIARYTPKTREEVLSWLDDRQKKEANAPAKKTTRSRKKSNPDDFLSQTKPPAEV
jgi:hypothetical protein